MVLGITYSAGGVVLIWMRVGQGTSLLAVGVALCKHGGLLYPYTVLAVGAAGVV